MKQKEASKTALNKAGSEARNPLGETTNHVHPDTPTDHIKRLEAAIKHHKSVVEDGRRKRLNERRRGNRLKKALEAHKVSIKQAKVEVQHLKRDMDILKTVFL
jgi:chromosome segregation ATPase